MSLDNRPTSLIVSGLPDDINEATLRTHFLVSIGRGGEREGERREELIKKCSLSESCLVSSSLLPRWP